MYLKSIEIHGFKSFANKIILEFHDGITTIVGPNGSGKSNVADAVRWVLGEQSAKQLRGVSMTDVIFAGSEVRKPMGFAYVCMTFDNSDHKLAIDYDEVSVARRVYRSGESEYIINGTTCRLRDIQELFMDTGIGKEGYSIIGQGQIDRILSTKPEDRRELFDEAVGIVKFKKRKAIAEKNLEEEKLNLSRVNDILFELNKQLGPLAEQSEVAKEYLKLKEQLKKKELNQFLLEFDRSESQKDALDEKLKIARNDYDTAVASRESAQGEYNALDERIEGYNGRLDEAREKKNADQIHLSEIEGEIRLIEEQIAGSIQNDSLIEGRLAGIDRELSDKSVQLDSYKADRQSALEETDKVREELAQNQESIGVVQNEIRSNKQNLDEYNSNIIRLLGESGSIKSELQKFETILEQNDIKKTELNQQLLSNKSEEDTVESSRSDFAGKLENIEKQIAEKKHQHAATRENIEKLDAKIKDARAKFENAQREYISEKSKLESLKNIAERYDGYGNSIRKIMEHRSSVRGIEGVVADIISVDRKYEVAIETALGGNIQNVVVDTEQTAKHLIQFLKVNRAGRATFLPLTSVTERGMREDYSSEKGVIGVASDLVSADSKYDGIVGYLLGRIVVVDNIDNALALAKKNNYSLRLVTLEGEQLNPGGSLSGGAYKNNSNLLGRKREIEELEAAQTDAKAAVDKLAKSIEELSIDRKEQFSLLDTIKQEQQELTLLENNISVSLRNEEDRLKRIRAAFDDIRQQLHEIEQKSGSLKSGIDSRKEAILSNDRTSQEMEEMTSVCQEKLQFLTKKEEELSEINTGLREKLTAASQKQGFIEENIARITAESEKLAAEREEVVLSAGRSEADRAEKRARAEAFAAEAEAVKQAIAECEKHIEELLDERDKLSADHKGFMAKWQELGEQVAALDKEIYRLNGQRERLKEQIDAQITYIWDEYEITPSTAEEFRDENIKNPAANKKDIAELKSNIKGLGDVNVGAIEEYKEVSERSEFLTAQRDDLEKSEETIIRIIEDLDSEMRKQFTEKFAVIKSQFNVVFRELFGGGSASLSLTEEEDVLTAGIIINAQPPGKKLQNMMQLSGGEKALTAISLLFAILSMKPSPFCLLDEIEAALDDSNVKRFASYLKKLTKNSQFIVITHRRGTMTAADIMYGITMQEKGVSTLVSVSLLEADLDE